LLGVVGTAEKRQEETLPPFAERQVMEYRSDCRIIPA
jgi:hypothetical protein